MFSDCSHKAEAENLPPQALTGGGGYTQEKQKRNLPDINFSSVPANYATLVAHGFDTIQEALNIKPKNLFIQRLEKAKEDAQNLDENEQTAVTIQINGVDVQVRPVGAKGGIKYVIETDDFLIMFRSPKMDWSVSLRYKAAGLWEHGLIALREQAINMLMSCCSFPPNDWSRLSRADFAFDFYSPAFSAEMKPEILEGVVCHSSTKKRIEGGIEAFGRSGFLETLTIGSKKGLQIQIYDKTKEITAVSGKTWMYDVWEAEGFYPPDDEKKDVWRLELRFAGEFLKNRNIRTIEAMLEVLPELVTEALFSRRLAIPDSDSNRSRWAMHPIWCLAWENCKAGEMLPIGKQITGKRAALKEQAIKQIAGGLRSVVVLQNYGEFNDDILISSMEEALETLKADPEHNRKILKAQERYKTVDEAQ